MNLKLKHKRLYALLVVLCLVLSLALLLTACKKNKGGDDSNDDSSDTGDNNNNNDNGGNNPTYQGGAEQGTYYYDVAGGEENLVLTAGSFTYTGSGFSKTGTYTVDGNKMVLTFANTADGTATATIGTDRITLTYNNATMTFLKKVPYTVTFSVDGGSAIDALSVVNGKTATKPSDPTKAGYIFLGWYTDSTLKTAYAFTTPVTANITLYAKWVQVDTSAPVYNVSYDLGYAGATAIASVSTVNGAVYTLPENPTRSGYTFAGWWVSMFEDGAKLTYEYTAGTKLNSDTTLFALWVPNDAQLAAPMVNVTANGLSWTAINDATKYHITVKDGEGNVITTYTTTTYNYTYKLANKDAGAYIFEVVAEGSGGKTSATTVRYYNNKALDRVSGLKVVDGKLVYSAVANATNYILTIDCGNKLHNHDALDNGNSTYFDFSNCSMQAGGIKFSVVASAEGYANSVASRVFVFEQNLASVGAVTYDEANDSFKWNAVANASAYKVVITVDNKSYTYNVTTTAISLADFTGNISVSVTPVADGYNSPAAATQTATKTAPAAVQNLALNGYVLSWSSNAGSYTVAINGKTYTVTETSFDLSAKMSELNLTTGSTYTVTVTATANGKTSAAASLETIYGKMSTTLTYSDKVVSWPSVIGYSNFKVKVNGTEFTVSGQNFASVTLTKAGENVIEVICTDLTNDFTNASKITVTAYAVKYVTRTSEGGEFTEYLAAGDTLTPPAGVTYAGYTFGGWYNTPLAAEDNGKEYTDSKFYGAADLTLYANWIPNKYNVTLNVDNSFVSNVTNGTKVEITYTKDFTLPVPVSIDESKGFFVGWFNAPNGGGLMMTDDLGNSVEPYNVIGDSVLYPYFAEALSYIEVKDEQDNVTGYYVTKGLGISNRNVTNIRIPAMYNGKPIVGIADNAFHSCYNIVSVEFPNTVEYVGKGAFELCKKLLSIDMYEVDPNSETPYSTHDGALMYYHATSGETYLEVFPAAKTGEYTVADNVDVIGPGAFQNSKISKIIISKGVTTISKNAFVNCTKLTEIEFAFEREVNVSIEDGAFSETANVTKIVLPAKLAALENIKVFDVFEDLAIIEIEPGGANYSSVNNLICDPYGTKLLYVPRSFRGTFEVPVGIDTIGDKLFYENPYITKVIIGEHVMNVGADAFYGCTALTEVVIKTPRETIFTINASAFSRCSNLKSVVIEGSDVTDTNENMPILIGENAFANCSKLYSFSVGDNAIVYQIEAGAFSYCTSLESFTVADSAQLRNIGNQVFKGCTGLTKFVIHKTTNSLGDGVFEDCTKLNTISLGEGASSLSLGADVFKNCLKLANIELPSSLTSFDPSLFDGCENIQNINVSANNPYLESHDGILYTKGCTEIIYYPRTREIENGVLELNLSTLKKIGPSVFKNNDKVVTVKIGAGIEEIAKNAFENCINLTTVEFEGANATFSIGAYAFAGCSKLKGITLPASTTRISSYAFDHSALESFTIPASTTYIGYNAFAFTDLTSIEIPASVTFIGHGAFYKAAKLSSVTFANRSADIEIGKWDDIEAKAEGINQVVENGTFMGTALESISLPKMTTYIGAYAFAGLTKLTSVKIPADAALVTIDTYAFKGTSVSEFTFNEGLTTIGAYAFANTQLASVTIPKSVQYINGYAFNTSTLTEVTFKEGSAEGIGLHIANGAFVGADLTSIHLPAQLKAFGEADSKYGFSAVSVFYTITENIDRDGDRFVDVVFSGNKNLTSISVSPDSITFAAVDGVLYKLQGVSDPSTGAMSYVPARLLFSPMGNLGNDGTVTVPKTVTMVDYTAFLRTQLKKIIFEEYAKDDPNYGTGRLSIGYYDAANTKHLFPGVITSIYDETKSGNDRQYTNLELIQFPSHLSKINYGAFYDLVSYKNNQANGVIDVKFNPDSTVKFGASAFRASTAIKSLELPKVSYISQMAFYQLYQVTNITFAPGSTVTDIGSVAFADCSKLTSITIPASVKTISNRAFEGCTNLTSFNVEDGSVLETIHDSAFKGMGSANDCAGIDYFKIPDTVKNIGVNVFENANIRELELSESLEIDTNSGSSVTNGCKTIEKIHVPEENNYLSSIDGIVYDKEQTVIYIIPPKWETDSDVYVIPSKVQTISSGAFANFKGSKIVLPEALTEIGHQAFQNAEITEIVIPDNVTVIGNYAFHNCLKLTKITISKNSKLTGIGDQAFNHTAITEIFLPDSVEIIGYSAFESCSKLTSIKLPASLKTIESTTFKNCTALATVELNDGLEMIKNNAFNSCAITEIDIPDSVTQLDQYVFNSCKKLKTFYCSDASALYFVGFSCFYGCSALESVTFGPAVKNFGYNNKGQYNTFNGCNAIKEIHLPAEMVKIPDGFFKNLVSLETLTLPAELEQLGIEAFAGCTALTEVTLPKTLGTIGEAAFAGCTSLKTVTFEDGSVLKILPANMFAECTALTSVTLPAGLLEIGDSAFAMTAITSLTLPKTLEEIGATAFFGCNVTSLEVPATVLVIGNEAFANCYNLETLTLNSGIKSIGGFAFANCSKLKSVTLPDTLTNLYANPFMGCPDLVLKNESASFIYENGILLDETGLTLIYYSPANSDTSFTLPASVVEIAGGAFSNAKLETIVLHERIKVIPRSAFAYCESLKNITIPNSVTAVEDSAFMGCSALETLTIPASVLSLGNYAFANCSSLSTFTLAERKDDITVGSHLFYGCASITKTYEFPGVTGYTPYMYAGTGITSIVFADNTNFTVEGVFANSALESVTFGAMKGNNNVIGKAFFAGSALKSIVIPEAFSSIGRYDLGGSVFANCKNLVSVTFSGTSIEASSFENCTALTTFIIVKPSYLDTRDEFSLSVDARAFANASALSNTNIFEHAQNIEDEAFLNCSGITGEIVLANKHLSGVGNYAFSGMTVSKITFSGREFNLNSYSLAGLTDATTVYFATASSYEQLVERMGGNGDFIDHTDANITYYTPNGDVEVTLNEKELAWLTEWVDAGEIAKEMMDAIQTAWIAYKGGFVTLYPADTLTKDEIGALDEFANNYKIGEKLRPELEKMWIEYKKTLAEELKTHSKYFTPDELEAFNELSGKMDDATKNAFMQAWFEYKIAYNDANPSDSIAKEDMALVYDFCNSIGLNEDFANELISRWPAYKKQLAAALVVPVYIDLTQEEFDALEKFCGNWEIKDGLEDLKQGWMAYKGALVIEGKEDAGELTAEEMALVENLVNTYGIDSKATQEFNDALLRYKQEYSKYFLDGKIAISDNDSALIKEFMANGGLDESVIEEVMVDLLAYKKNFCLSGYVPGKELSDDEIAAYMAFMDKYGVDSRTAEKMMETFMVYRVEFAAELGRDVRK